MITHKHTHTNTQTAYMHTYTRTHYTLHTEIHYTRTTYRHKNTFMIAYIHIHTYIITHKHTHTNTHSTHICISAKKKNGFVKQEKKPKIAVVLSGGGAKGVAHIPLLQTLDSLGIVPDLVVGTSMGSLVGGFYAMGYSGDSIAEITRNADWDKLLGGKTLLKDVGVEEKSEFDRYLLTLDFKTYPSPSSSNRLSITCIEFFTYDLGDVAHTSLPPGKSSFEMSVPR